MGSHPHSEHLRRLCHRHYQRSPMAYLAQLRMQRAGILLRSTPAKVEEVAQTILFLASPDNRVTRGAVVPVFGKS